MWASSRSLCRKVSLVPLLRAPLIPAPSGSLSRAACASPASALWAACVEESALLHPVTPLPGVPRGRMFASAPPAGLEPSADHPQPWGAPEAAEGENGSEAAGHFLTGFNIDVLVALLRQENAKDVCVIKVPLEVRYTEYFVIASASSTRHLKAIAQFALKVYKQVKGRKESHVKMEGKDTDDWMCIDFGNIVVHIMLPETREIYELEKLWTLRAYDDQLAKITPETLPVDFIYGLNTEEYSLEEGIKQI